MVEIKIENNPVLLEADDLAEKGNKAFLSYTWKLNRTCVDYHSFPETNPYSEDKWANDVSYPEYDLELAYDYYQQAFAKYVGVLGPDHIKTAEILAQLGDVCRDPMYDNCLSRDYYERALPVYENKKSNSRDLAVIYENLGSVCFAMNDLLSSLDYNYKSQSQYNKLAICGEEWDISQLKESISEAEEKLGLHIVVENEKYGFADKDGKIVIPCVWKSAKDFSEGLAPVMNDNGNTDYINYHGEVVISDVYGDGFPFHGGIAYIMSDAEDGLVNSSYYIDKDGVFLGCEDSLGEEQIKTMYEAEIMFIFDHYNEAIEHLIPVAEQSDIDILPSEKLVGFYEALGQYDKVVEWCKKIEENEIFADHYAWPKLKLGECYEKGLGVDVDLLKASYWYDMIQIVDELDEEEKQERNDFFKRHPEMVDIVDTLPEF